MGTNEKRRRRLIKQIIAILVVLAAFVGLVFFLNSYEARDSYVGVHFVNSGGVRTPEFSLEVADSPSKRGKGLMYRKSMEPDEGMVFVFPKEDELGFWMRNTYISLDMIFLNKDRKVTSVIENVPVLNDEVRKGSGKNMYVIELNSGASKKHGIGVGSEAVFDRELVRAP